jgi:hypothetical protein
VLKVFSFLSKREDVDTRAFIDYYENNHVPLVLSLVDRSRTRAYVIEEHVTAG